MATDSLQDARALDKHRSGRYGAGMIERVAKLQSDVEYIKRDVADVKTDMRAMRVEMREMRIETHGELRDARGELQNVRGELRDVRGELWNVRDRQERDFRLLFGALITVAIGLAGLSAKGFGWL